MSHYRNRTGEEELVRGASDASLREQLPNDASVQALKKLEGKVVCSACGHKYTGKEAENENQWRRFCRHFPKLVGADSVLKATRFMTSGASGSDLTVDLWCVLCDHTGLYKFEGNPFIGEDIPF